MKKVIAVIASVIIVAALVLISDIGYLRGLSVSDSADSWTADGYSAQTPSVRPSTSPEPSASPSPVPPKGTVYLTFDDGPFMYTGKLLDTLKKEDVKASFFVTGQNPDYLNMIAREYGEGHTVGAHCCAHEYGEIYKSDEAFFEDLNSIQKIIHEQTGEFAVLYRFPGGSSNTVSEKYCKGIVSRVSRKLEERGYVYVDWDIASGDSDGIHDSSKLADNVMEELEKTDGGDVVILMHDIYEWTVDAVPEVIDKVRDEGYTFAALSAEGPAVHFEIAN